MADAYRTAYSEAVAAGETPPTTYSFSALIGQEVKKVYKGTDAQLFMLALTLAKAIETLAPPSR
jgi:hypothetical protein